MKKVMLDPGHGDFDPGAIGNGLKEADLTWNIATKTGAILEQCGVAVFYTREQYKTATKDKNFELAYRCKLANEKRVDAYVSLHINAGGGSGYESYRYLTNEPTTVSLQNLIHRQVEAVFSTYGMINRGIKQADFAVLRGTKMPAVLLEIGFIDNVRDAKFISSDNFQNKIAEAIARGICEWLKIPYLEESTARVIKEISATINGQAIKAIVVGENTHLIWFVLNTLGYNENIDFSYVFKEDSVTFLVAGQEVPGVVYKNNSYLRWNKIPGMKEAKQRNDGGWDFVAKPNIMPKPELVGTPILGKATATIEQLLGYAKSINEDFPEQLPSLYLKIGERYGIKGDIAFVQMLKETGYFRFGGDVRREQNNMAGIGATGNGNPGASFVSMKEGVTAHIQHLFAYCSTKDVPAGEKVVDPRFHLVSRGSAPTWESLNGKWAVPGTNYGQDILAIHKKVVEFKVKKKDYAGHWAEKEITHVIQEGLMQGFDDGNFYPDRSLTRAELAVVLTRIFNLLKGGE